MSEKVSLEKLLPIALELYKTVPSVAVQLKAKNESEQQKKALEIADSFAAFTLRLHQKLSESE